MKSEITKLCADSLNEFVLTKCSVKIKAAHAHELGAAFFGYPSKNAMLADVNYPISGLQQAEIIVMVPDSVINERRKTLHDLPRELPDSDTLGERIYTALFSDNWWSSSYPPFRSFEKLAKFLVENNEAYKQTFQFYKQIPMHHTVEVGATDNNVVLRVLHSHKTKEDEELVDGKTTIELPRVAGRVGYGCPQISVEIHTAQARQTLRFRGQR